MRSVRPAEQGRAGNHRAVPLGNQEPVDHLLQILAGAGHQDTGLFQGAEQLADAGDVVDAGRPQFLEGSVGDQYAGAVAGEELPQQVAVAGAADQVHPTDAAAAGVGAAAQGLGELLRRRRLGASSASTSAGRRLLGSAAPSAAGSSSTR
jgi:hypothetical protein